MTASYARWAFLAAEDDPVATFIECVREESSVYPRPMARESLANDPFRMKAEAVEAAFAEARAQGRADDIERVEASNGDVYFYSTTYFDSSPRPGPRRVGRRRAHSQRVRLACPSLGGSVCELRCPKP